MKKKESLQILVSLQRLHLWRRYIVLASFMPVTLLFFQPNYAKTMLVFPSYASFFLIVLFKNHGK